MRHQRLRVGRRCQYAEAKYAAVNHAWLTFKLLGREPANADVLAGADGSPGVKTSSNRVS